MKKIHLSSLAAILLWMCQLSFATTVFPPVKWQLGQSQFAGGIQYKNDTSKKQYVQVVIKQGIIAIYTLDHDMVSCQSTLKADSTQASRICALSPNASLHIDLDMHSPSARGNYQVAVMD